MFARKVTANVRFDMAPAQCNARVRDALIDMVAAHAMPIVHTCVFDDASAMILTVTCRRDALAWFEADYATHCKDAQGLTLSVTTY